MIDKTKYIIGCDLAYRPNWFIRQLQKIGFYKKTKYPKYSVFRIREDGIFEQIKDK